MGIKATILPTMFFLRFSWMRYAGALLCMLFVIGVSGYAQPLKITYLLPVDAGQYHLDSSGSDANKNYSNLTNLSLDFYQGSLLAIQDLRQKGLKGVVEIRDTGRGLDSLRKMMKDGSLASSDLIIGPFFPDQIAEMSSWMEYHQIPVISPLSPQSLRGLQNPYLISAITPIGPHGEKLAAYVATKMDSVFRVLILYDQQAQESDFATPFVETLNKLAPHILIDSMHLYQEDLSNVQQKLFSDTPNLIFVPSQDASFLASMTSFFQGLDPMYRYILLGHPKWLKLESMSIDFMQKSQAHMTTSFHVDYTTPRMRTFIKRYRESYFTDPGEYALKGYDVSRYFLSLIHQYGDRFLKKMETHPGTGLCTRFEVHPVTLHNWSGYELPAGYWNTWSKVLRFDNFELIEVY